MSKLWIITLTITSLSAVAECPSVDQNLAFYSKGASGVAEIIEASLCRIDEAGAQPNSAPLLAHLCATRVGLLQDRLAILKAQYEVGLAGKDQIEKTEARIAEIKSSCAR